MLLLHLFLSFSFSLLNGRQYLFYFKVMALRRMTAFATTKTSRVIAITITISIAGLRNVCDVVFVYECLHE